MTWQPIPKIYDASLTFSSAKKYGYLIGKKYLEKKCKNCYAIKNVHFHHKNENKWDNRLSNIVPLCSSCHRIWHEKHDKKLFSVHRNHSILMKKLYRSGKIEPWNKGLDISDKRVAELGKKISISKQSNPYVMSIRHKKILFSSSHTDKANIKRSDTMKRIWLERKGGVA